MQMKHSFFLQQQTAYIDRTVRKFLVGCASLLFRTLELVFDGKQHQHLVQVETKNLILHLEPTFC